jgi:hypothetical protein
MFNYIETLFSPRYVVAAEAIAFDGTGRIWRHLERATAATWRRALR